MYSRLRRLPLEKGGTPAPSVGATVNASDVVASLLAPVEARERVGGVAIVKETTETII